MKIQVRDLSPSDKAAWQILWQEYLTFYESEVTEDVTEGTWQRLLFAGEDPCGLCAVDEHGALVGIVHYMFHRSTWTVGDYCYLQDLYVSPAARRAGVGRSLIFAVKAEAEKKGASQVYWLTQESNEKARRLYDQVGELTPFIKYKCR